MTKIVHIITGLETGGAEMMLLKLLQRLDRKVFPAEVVSLTGIGAVGRQIADLEIPVRALGMSRALPSPLALLKLTGMLRRSAPDLVQTWMYHADLVGGLAAKLAGGPPVVWGVRHSRLDPQLNRRRTLRTAQLCARLSRLLPRHILCCSEASRRAHAELGYAAERMSVIPNGFDAERFRPDAAARSAVRQELQLPAGRLLVGQVARFDPVKDHATFFRAAGILLQSHPGVDFLLCGEGVSLDNRSLQSLLADLPQERFHLLGRREDIPRLTAALDLATSSSLSEGFPNALGEAMACGVPCVATDVGDSGLLIDGTGRVVPPGDPEALASSMAVILDLDSEERLLLGEKARQRIIEKFSLQAIVHEYQNLYSQLSNDG